MSKVITKYFQKCDMCKQEFQLKSVNESLGKAVLPGWFIPCDGSRPKPTLIPVHLCPSCLQEISEYLRDKYLLNDADSAGTQIGKVPTVEETEHE